jgi:hypothetical protein
MNSKSQEVLAELHTRLISLCSQFRHADNQAEKSKLQSDLGKTLQSIAHVEAQIKAE